ncbi:MULTISPECIES: ABC transporter permease [Thalassobaculum]|uniref:Peptide/nickel transport system permease protein n=1 Tax=Thalassobaculum litoreum DSM 18839 TaxID=1123362 RepID=A0A8G2BG40_9PROT|nr:MULTISPECIES: ABC transporter permease [Thalassobaculum]SDF50351.1 peptide/nickel transport system permease protein [Thalassobaculum litoreum DSM 18839]
MLVYTAKRLLLAILVSLTVSALVFSLLYLSGDPATALAGERANEADIQAIKAAYGFDQPVYVQYFKWLGGAVQGEFGQSVYFRMPVIDLIVERLPVTMMLGVSAMIFALVLAIPLGVLAAMYQNSLIDRAALLLAVVGQAMPSFWFALMLIVVFAYWVPILPASGSDSWEHFVLPTIVLGYYATPAFMRLTRTGLLDVLSSDYVRTARAKGLSPAMVLFKHALRNAIIPVVSLAAVQFGFMLTGSIIIETVFALHGAGFLAWESISRSDFPTVQAVLLLFSWFYIILTFLADLLNAWLNPRIRVA